MDNPIYLDHNATTPIDPAVLDAMLPWMRGSFGNPSSAHPYGREARKAIDNARQQVASLIGCEADEVIFTSGGTESNNLAVFGSVKADTGGRRRIVTSKVEHPAIARPCDRLEEEGYEVIRVPVDSNGRVLVEDVQTEVVVTTVLVTVMLANNETGSIMPIGELSTIAHDQGALLHGANHERGLRPGTENVPYIVGLGKACKLAHDILERESARERSLRDRLWELLSTGIPGLLLNGHPRERLPNTLNVSFPRAQGSRILEVASDIAASTGSACHEGIDTPSEVLLAMGAGVERGLGAVRLSIGRGTTSAHIEEVAHALTATMGSREDRSDYL